MREDAEMKIRRKDRKRERVNVGMSDTLSLAKKRITIRADEVAGAVSAGF